MKEGVEISSRDERRWIGCFFFVGGEGRDRKRGLNRKWKASNKASNEASSKASRRGSEISTVSRSYCPKVYVPS